MGRATPRSTAWFRILQRKRFRIADFAPVSDLRAQVDQFVAEWNQGAHPFSWTTKSVAKITAKAPAEMAA